MDNKTIVLGSGGLYVMEFAGDIPENNIMETEANRLGYIQGGATLEYKPTFHVAKDDFAIVRKDILTDEEATLKSGVMTWCGETLQKLCATARVDDSTPGIRKVKVGGIGNQDGKKYLFHFWHKDPNDGDIRVTIVGTNQAGFKIAFVKDKETVIDAVFKAMPSDDEGTLVIYEEETAIGA